MPIAIFIFTNRRGAESSFLCFHLSAWRRIQFFAFSPFGVAPNSIFCVFAFRRGTESNFFVFSPFGVAPIAVFSVFAFRRDADCSFCFHLSARNSRTELTADFCKRKNSASCPQTISSNGMIPRAEFDRFPAVEKFRELSARAFMKHCYDTQVIPNSKTFVLAFFSESAIKKHKNLKRI